jgi:hypothetical protein
MPYLPYEEDKENQTQPGQPGAEPPVLGAPGAAPIQGSGGGQAATTSQGKAQGTKSGSFTNLLSYVGANQGNDAAMAGTVRGNTQAKAQGAQQAGEQFKGTANQLADTATIRDAGINQQVAALPQKRTQAAPATIDQQAFNRQYNAEYRGPKSASDIQGYGETGQQYQKVQQYGQLAGGDMADRGALLTDAYGKGGNQYNSGERRLDSFILGAGQQGQQAMQQIAQDYGDYNKNFQGILDYIGAADTGTGRIGQAVADTAATKASTRAAVDKARQGFQSIFDPAANKAAEATRIANQDYQQLDSGAWDAYQDRGIDDNTLKFLDSLGVDYGRLIAEGPTAYKLGDFVDEDTRQSYGGLMGLLTGAGDTSQPAVDLSAGGGKRASLRDDILSAAASGSQPWQDAQKAAATSNATRDSVWAMAQRDPAEFVKRYANVLGLTHQQADLLANSGADLSKMLSKRDAITVGDALERAGNTAQYQNLFKMLGLNSPQLLRQSGNYTGEGAYRFGTTLDKASALEAIKRYQDYLAANTQTNSINDGYVDVMVTDEDMPVKPGY